MQGEQVMIAAGAAEIARLIARCHRRQPPHGFIKARRLVGITGAEFDAADAANRTTRHIHVSPLSVLRNCHYLAVHSNHRRVARSQPFGKRAMHARNIGCDAGEESEGFDGLIHAHAGPAQDARTFTGRGFEEFGFARRIDDVGGPMCWLERGHGYRVSGNPLMPTCVALTTPSAAAMSRGRSSPTRQRSGPQCLATSALSASTRVLSRS